MAKKSAKKAPKTAAKKAPAKTAKKAAPKPPKKAAKKPAGKKAAARSPKPSRTKPSGTSSAEQPLGIGFGGIMAPASQVEADRQARGLQLGGEAGQTPIPVQRTAKRG